MGLRQRVQRLAVRRVHVLLAEVPGNFELRVETERLMSARGWVLALSPADADALLVVGAPDADLQTAIDAVYDQMPGPRATAAIESVAHVDDRLDGLRDALLDDRAQLDDARARTAPEDDHAAMDHGDMDMKMDHGDMDHGDMDMAPSGIPLAEGGDDRDGLEMDRTHLFLGPILSHWPAGLSLRCTLHGDTMMDHTVLSAPSTTQSPSAAVRAAQYVDAAVDVFALAGSLRAAERLRSLRDRALASEGDPSPDLRADLRAEHDRLEDSRLLRWALGDAHADCLALLDRAVADLAGHQLEAHRLTALADLIDGQDLATVRLRIAAAGPDLWNTVEVG
ncbi:hypothetical protein GCM10027020_32890 [Nocardioides salsibiostraticola]